MNPISLIAFVIYRVRKRLSTPVIYLTVDKVRHTDVCSVQEIMLVTQGQSETFNEQLLKSETHLSMKYCNKTKINEN